MRKQFILSCAIALSAIAFVGCSEESDELKYYTTESSGPTPTLEGFNQIATTTPEAISLGEGVDFTFEWEANETFAVYENDGDWVANLKISDPAATVKTFTIVGDTLLDDSKLYVAVYPAPKSGEEGSFEEYSAKLSTDLASAVQHQEGESLSHLKSMLSMKVVFKGDDPITFEYLNAFMAINFQVTVGDTPSSLKFEDGDNASYTINFSDLAASSSEENSYRAYLAINPARTAARTQKFYLPSDSSQPVRTIEGTTDSYSAGEAYELSTFTVETYSEVEVAMPEAITSSDKSVSFAWEQNDKLSLFNASTGKWIADCSITDITASKFLIDGEDITVNDKGRYIAVYPAKGADEDTYESYIEGVKSRITTSTQNADNSSAHLKNMGWFTAEFKGGEAAKLEYQNAIVEVSVVLDEAIVPTSIQFVVDNSSYELSLNNFVSASSFTAYLSVTPATLESAEQSVNISYDVESSKKFNLTAGVDYPKGVISTLSTENMISASLTQIGTPTDLLTYLANPTADAILTADIDLSTESDFTPTAYLTKEFNGNNFKISNLSVTVDGSEAGLFKGINSGGIVKNLTLANPTVKATQYVGAIAGKIMAGGSIIDCKVTGADIYASNNISGGVAGQSLGTITGTTFEGKVSSEKGNTGGIVGICSGDDTYYSIISNCSVNAEITHTSGENAAGVIGKSTSVNVSDCTFSGSIVGVKNLAGISGYNVTTKITNCTNNAKITATGLNIGGIAANIDGATHIIGCVNNGELSSSSNVVGGILGVSTVSGDTSAEATTSVIGCVNTANIKGVNKVGGVVGTLSNGGFLVACYNTGDVSATSSSTSTGKPVAGVIAEAKVNTTIVGCYNIGSVTSELSGYVALPCLPNPAGTSSIKECYYISTSAVSSDKGTHLEDVAALNAKLESINSAIKATDFSSYTFVEGEKYPILSK